MQTEKDRILELRKALEYHNYKYYIENAPEISDREFDGLMHDLEKLEEKYPEMYDPNSPTQRVGRDINQEFTYTVEITNNTGKHLKIVRVSNGLPTGVERLGNRAVEVTGCSMFVS